jgi:nucleoside-diphosphate-sugar epimerase
VTEPEERPAWVIGSGGLLGGAVVRRLRRRGGEVLVSSIPWHDSSAALAVLLRDAGSLPEVGAEVYWCAGAGVVGTSVEALDDEVELLTAFLAGWQPQGSCSFFLASSAGGVYAGSSGPPFNEDSVPNPLAPYGHAKLRAEEVVRQFAERTGSSALIGRISNLYGPGQDISKPQGLISQLIRAQVTRQPLSIYVSLDTMRDYLYVDDAADMVVTGLGLVGQGRGVHVKVLASERAVTIAAILADLRRISRRRAMVVLGASPNSRFQVRDLRMRSTAWPPLGPLVRTPLIVGMSSTISSLSPTTAPWLERG